MTWSEVSAYGHGSDPTRRQHVDLPDLLDSRRTIRAFSSRPVHDDDLANVLWAAQGQTFDGRRTTPSAAGRYPLQLIIVRGPHPVGTWTWAPEDRSLVPRGTGDVRTELSAAAIGEQPWVLTAPVTVVFCADVDGMVEHFADQPPDGRGRRYVDVEIGAAVQNLALSCTARGMGGVIVGGFDDDLVADTLDLDTYEPRLLFSLGHPA
jgi:nitroreductase